MKEVQAFITNISFPNTMTEFLGFLEDDFRFDVDLVLTRDYLEWTAPRWCKTNDIVFFMHSKTAISKITRLRTEYLNNKSNYSKKQQVLIENGIEHGIDDYKKYGGKIFAIGQVVHSTVYDNYYSENDVEVHWRGRIYAPISNVIVLKNPIDISEFNDFIFISRQSAITGVFGKEFDRLKELILSKNNNVKKYFKDSISVPLPLKDVNSTNWISISSKYRREFFLESQFRSYYTDYLLEELTDTKVYKECACKTYNKPDYFVDNVITINNKPILVEIKLNINNEKDLLKQMKKYCNCNKIVVGNRVIQPNKCKALIIDTNGIYLFDNAKNRIIEIYDFNELTELKDIQIIKQVIVEKMQLSKE